MNCFTILQLLIVKLVFKTVGTKRFLIHKRIIHSFESVKLNHKAVWTVVLQIEKESFTVVDSFQRICKIASQSRQNEMLCELFTLVDYFNESVTSVCKTVWTNLFVNHKRIVYSSRYFSMNHQIGLQSSLKNLVNSKIIVHCSRFFLMNRSNWITKWPEWNLLWIVHTSWFF